jgi:hypothetical protein
MALRRPRWSRPDLPARGVPEALALAPAVAGAPDEYLVARS